MAKAKNVHTLVMHVFPDIETLFMGYALTHVDAARERANVADDVAFKFIPSGELRAEDWPGENDLNAEALEEKGYLFLDCGGGRFDQHGKPVNALQNTMSSLDIMVHALELDHAVPHLMPLVEIISKNDLTGQDVARDRDMKRSKTPHTPRHLRNIVQGWNMRHVDDPRSVLHCAFAAFRGMEDALTRGGAEDASSLFLLDVLTKVVERAVASEGPDAVDPDAAKWFRESATDALGLLEKDWDRAVNDYWNSSKVIDVAYAAEVKGGMFHRHIPLAYGDSVSHRYGQVTRLGNTGPRHKRPHQRRGHRPKAEVTIQFRGEGMFIISTRGIELDRVARVLRTADLRKRGVALDPDTLVELDRTGSPVFTDKDGRRVTSLYLAEYRTCFGNTFRTNPNAEPSVLTRQEVVDLTVKALGDVDA